MCRRYCSQAVKWTLACNAGKSRCLPNACRWASGSLTMKAQRGNRQTCTGSQQETRCLWHPRWLWLSRPAFSISPACCTCQEKYGGRGSHCIWCLPCLSAAGKHITHLPGWARSMGDAVRARCKGARTLGASTLEANPQRECWVNESMTKAKMKTNMHHENGYWSSAPFHSSATIPLE